MIFPCWLKTKNAPISISYANPGLMDSHAFKYEVVLGSESRRFRVLEIFFLGGKGFGFFIHELMVSSFSKDRQVIQNIQVDKHLIHSY